MTLETPTPSADRLANVDVIRGVSLLGVLLVNATTLFRVSPFLYLEVFHTDPGALNHVVDWTLAMVMESKSFALFSLLFGVSLSIFHERAASRGPQRGARLLLARRLLVLLVIGLAHLVLVWNGDILAAYAVAGFAVLPLIGWRPRVSLAVALAMGVVYCLPLSLPDLRPHGAAAMRHGAEAARVYGGGSWREIFAFRAAETREYMLPLLAMVLPRIAGLFLLGDWIWRRSILRDPDTHRTLLRATTAIGLLVGGAATAIAAVAATKGSSLGRLEPLASSLSNVPLALGYGAGLVLLLQRSGWRAWLVRAFAPLGRMALTNYLAQSAVFTLIFYGFGAGLFGRLDASTTALLACAVYVLQALASAAWLRAFRFGPCEWLWRSVTYGHWQPMTHARAAR